MTVTAADIEAKPVPSCPECGKPMKYHGGTQGFEHCGWKLLYRAGGWRDQNGEPLKDRRLTWP